MAKRYWLFKSEPDVFSFSDLQNTPDATTCWEGVRNYQARNLLRDDMQVGDGVLYYHSNAKPQVIAGRAEIVRAGYPDHYQFDPKHKYFDPKASEDNPRWYMVDIKAVKAFKRPLTLPELKQMPEIEDMMLVKKGSRLSVQPVSKAHWQFLTKLGLKG